MTRLIAAEGPPVIGPGTRVTLHFSVLLSTGEEVDGTRRRNPATFDVGDGQLLPGFEQALFGMSAGDDAQLSLEPDQAFGPWRQDNEQTLSKERFTEFDLEPGLLISFAAADGELPGIVKKVFEKSVLVDFNHPLAGKTLCFDVTILQVETLLNSLD